MLYDEVVLEVLRNTDKVISQKTLAKEIGHSVGKVNYVIKHLVAKGLIKVEKFMNSDNKLQYKYLITEAGIKQKIEITERFIVKEKQAYDRLQAELDEYKRSNSLTTGGES